MSASGWWGRAQNLGRALRLHRRIRERERWPRERIQSFQRERLGQIVAHASRHSPFYRDLYGGEVNARELRLEALPVVTKTAMMDDFDRALTDRRLRHADLAAHLETLSDDRLYLNEFRVMASSGSGGRKGIFVFDRAEWAMVVAGVMRWMDMVGVRPTLPRRTRLATVGAPDAKHMTFRAAASIDVGLHRTLRMAATQPLDDLVARLNDFQPDVLFGYPSVLALLAAEQQAGRLRISPHTAATSSELRTEEMSARMRAAWNCDLFDCLGLTETGIAAADCPAHTGLHINEDLCVLEVVDHDNRPVAYGEQGAKVLVTSLFRRTQPIIRMEVSDLLAVTDTPCECGRSFMRITHLVGRSDDMLELPGAHGGSVRLHPIHLRSALTRIPEIAQYQIVHDPDRLDVRLLVNAADSTDAVLRRTSETLAAVLRTQGAAALPLMVRAVEHIDREPGAGKLKLIKSNVPRKAG